MSCQRCGKVRYATEQAAEAAIRWISAIVPDGTRRPIRAYRSVCGWVHLTSQPAPAWAARPKEHA